MKHFEDLWTECEENFDVEDSTKTLNVIELKLALFKAVLSKKDILPKEDYNEAVYRLFGETLLSLTQVSLSENINVYKALDLALKLNQVDVASKLSKQ